MIKKLLKRYRKYQKKKQLQSIRESLRFCGYDMSDYSDEEIEEAMVSFSKIASKVGVTCEEATQALKEGGIEYDRINEGFDKVKRKN